MKPRKTSQKLIERAIAEKWTRQLAFFHLLKFEFNNSCIYRYKSRTREIADMFKISEKTLYNYLNFLRAKGLISDHSNNLKLSSIRAFSGRNKAIIFIDDSYTLWDVCCLLYAKIIEKKAKQMAFRESLRKFGTGDRLKGVFCENPFRLSLSMRTVAKVLNCSEYKAFKIMQNLCRLDVLRTYKQPPELLSNDFKAIYSVADYPGYLFNINNKLFRQFGNLIEFLQFPVYLKRITIQQYKKFNIKHL